MLSGEDEGVVLHVFLSLSGKVCVVSLRVVCFFLLSLSILASEVPAALEDE